MLVNQRGPMVLTADLLSTFILDLSALWHWAAGGRRYLTLTPLYHSADR